MYHFIPQIRYHVRDLWLPTDLNELGLWLFAADSTNTGDGGDVTEWTTSDGNSNTFNNINGTYYPTYNSSGNNSRPTVSFTYSTSTDYEAMDHNNVFLFENSWTICILFNIDSISGTYTLLSQSDYRYDNRWIAIQVADQRIQVIQKAGNAVHKVTGSTNLGTGFHIATIQSWGTGIRNRGIMSQSLGGGNIIGNRPFIENLSIRIDGVAETLSSGTDTSWGSVGSNEFVLGAYYSSSSVYHSNSLKGDLQHVVVCNPRLLSSDLSNLETYLSTYGNI